jgi:hypothetical protein
LTTSTASATVLNPVDVQGGRYERNTSGAPFQCNADGSIGLRSLNLAGAFTSCDEPTITDFAGVVNFVCE